MAPANQSGSTVPRRQLGRHLREARLAARMTLRAAAQALDRAEATLWRMESGRVPMRIADVQAMCRIYGLSPEMTEAFVALAQETKARGWWHAYGDIIPEWFNVFVGLEEAASLVQTYQPDLVPGLLQTPDYARSVFRSFDPEMEQAEVEARVDLRMARQVLLTRTSVPLTMQIVLEEAMFRRRIGTPRIIAEQCRRLADLCELPQVDLRIIPTASDLHAGAKSGGFVILRFPTDEGREADPSIVYVQGLTGALYLDKPNELDAYSRAFESITRAGGSGIADKSREILWKVAQEVME